MIIDSDFRHLIKPTPAMVHVFAKDQTQDLNRDSIGGPVLSGDAKLTIGGGLASGKPC
jgi:hypothetical protein